MVCVMIAGLLLFILFVVSMGVMLYRRAQCHKGKPFAVDEESVRVSVPIEMPLFGSEMLACDWPLGIIGSVPTTYHMHKTHTA